MNRTMTVRGLAVLAGAALVSIGLAAPGGAAAATRGTAANGHVATVGTHYAVTKRLCAAAPKPGYAACDAMRLIRVSKSTPGARPLVETVTGPPTGPAGGYTPGDLATAYGFDPAGGAGQTIGIVDAYDDPNIATDLATFDTNYGLPAETLGTTFEKVSQTGSTVLLPPADTSGWSGEEALDVETARGVCNLCKIILVEASSPNDTNLAAGVKEAVKLGATEVSNSYGGPEKPNLTPARRAAYQKLYNYPGVVITASTGDDGWFSWDGVNNGGNQFAPSAEAPNVPATLPTVVAVGGTYLGLTPAGTRASESVWNENGPFDSTAFVDQIGALGASGGGCSVLYKAQGWQANVPGYSKTGCGKTRLAADISADADPYSGLDVITTYDCGTPCAGEGSWETIGGTSLSSPLIASMWALAGGAGGVAYPAMSLYGHAIASAPPLFDVKVGGNSWCDQDSACAHDTHAEIGISNPNNIRFTHGPAFGTLDCGYVRNSAKATVIPNNHQCEAAKGYDGPSGVGTPVGLNAFKPLSTKAKIHAPSTIKKKLKATFSGGGSDPFPGGFVATYAWKWGDGHQTSTSSKASSHTYSKRGHFTVTLTETDVYGNVATTTASVTVNK